MAQSILARVARPNSGAAGHARSSTSKPVYGWCPVWLAMRHLCSLAVLRFGPAAAAAASAIVSLPYRLLSTVSLVLSCLDFCSPIHNSGILVGTIYLEDYYRRQRTRRFDELRRPVYINSAQPPSNGLQVDTSNTQPSPCRLETPGIVNITTKP